MARGAYFWRMTNGWTVILTIPFHAILQGDANLVVYLMAGIAVLLFAVLAYMSIRDVVQGRAARRANDAAHMLGDSFYGDLPHQFSGRRVRRHQDEPGYPA